MLRGNDMEYVPDFGGNLNYRYFFARGTNDIYRLNTETRELITQEYDTENDTSVIRTVLTDGKRMLLSKRFDDGTCKLFLVPAMD